VITDRDGKPLRRGRIYNFNISAVETVKVLDYRIGECFEGYCTIDGCNAEDVHEAYILVKIVKGERSYNEPDVWVFHVGSLNLISWGINCWTLAHGSAPGWFDIWEP